jgi:hypothetical protein
MRVFARTLSALALAATGAAQAPPAKPGPEHGKLEYFVGGRQTKAR